MAPSPSAAPSLPLHSLSVGDGIVVHSDADRRWLPAEVTAASGDHRCEVRYEDGSREWLSLDKVRYMPRRRRQNSARGRCRGSSSGSDDEEGEDDDEEFSPTEGIKGVLYGRGRRNMVACRKSKRLQEKLEGALKDSCFPEPSALYSTSDDDSLDEESSGDAVDTDQCTSSGLICLICQTGLASNFFILCKNAGCVRAFHAFCLHPPLKTDEEHWICPLCEGEECFLSKSNTERKSFLKKIQNIVGHRRVILDDMKSTFQIQFLVKWESLSHHYDSWVPLEWLYVIDRARLRGYQKKYILSKEIEAADQRKPEWLEIDRIIACRRKSNPNSSCELWSVVPTKPEAEEFEFLVKWKGLDYSDATWESSCTDELLAAVCKCMQRHQRASGRVDSCSPTFSMCSCSKIPEDMYVGTLYDYQLQGLQWILSNYKVRRNVILADEMGLGKTVQVVCFLHCVMHETSNVYPALVIAPKSILLQWEKEFHCWAEDLNIIIYQGDKQSRQYIKAYEMYSSEKRALFDALVTSYELVQLDSVVLKKFKWSAIIIDEAHKIKNLDCKLASCLKQYNSEFRLLLTGTPLQNTLLELFALLHFVDPDEFSDPKAEAESFSAIGTGLQDSYSEIKIAQIHELLKPRMLRRLKSDVLPESIPPKKWVEVPCTLTDFQRNLYIDILEKNYSKLNKGIQSGRKITLNSILTALRKCCNHPYLFPGQETDQPPQESIFLSLVAASGKLQFLEKLLPKFKERGNRVVIFSQMTKMLDILEDFLSFTGFTFVRIDGQTPLSARQQRMKEYNRPGSEIFIFLMSTRAGGLGIDLPGADRVIIYDPDFNPFMDLQAQSRAHRIGQTRPVVVYQLITKCSVEEKILQKSKQKLALENLVMNPSKKPNVSDLHSILLHGARTILNRKKVHATLIHYDDDAIERLLKLDPAPGEKCAPDANGYLGSIQSFSYGSAVENEEPPHSPKAEDWKDVLGPIETERAAEDFGRGKRRKKAVNYECDDSADSDDAYSPEGSSVMESSSSDDESDMVPETAPEI